MTIDIKESSKVKNDEKVLRIRIDRHWNIDDFLKIFAAMFFSYRLFGFIELVKSDSFSNYYPHIIADEVLRDEIMKNILERHFRPLKTPEDLINVNYGVAYDVFGEEGLTGGVLELPGHARFNFPVVRVRSIKFSSPGMLDLIGASGILKEMKSMYELHIFREEKRKELQIKNQILAQEVIKSKLENIEHGAKILKKLGYDNDQIKEMLGHAEEWIKQIDDFGNSGKITSIELKNPDHDK